MAHLSDSVGCGQGHVGKFFDFPWLEVGKCRPEGSACGYECSFILGLLWSWRSLDCSTDRGGVEASDGAKFAARHSVIVVLL